MIRMHIHDSWNTIIPKCQHHYLKLTKLINVFSCLCTGAGSAVATVSHPLCQFAVLHVFEVRESIENSWRKLGKRRHRPESQRSTVHANDDGDAKNDDRLLGNIAQKIDEKHEEEEEGTRSCVCVCVCVCPWFERQNTKSVCQITMGMFLDAMACIGLSSLKLRHDKLVRIFQTDIWQPKILSHTHTKLMHRRRDGRAKKHERYASCNNDDRPKAQSIDEMIKWWTLTKTKWTRDKNRKAKGFGCGPA